MNNHVSGEDLAAYVDGLLSAAKKSEMESHFSRCPACLDELADITALRQGRDKIPARFLIQALGEENKAAKPVLHLRLVFEVAAAVLVVVFIGYFFLNNNRFWQTGEQQQPLVMTDKNVGLTKPFAAVREQESLPLPAQKRDRAAAGKANSELTEADADQRLADSLVSEKRKNAATDKGLLAGSGESAPLSAPENKLQEAAEAQPQPTDEKENVLKKELARTAMVPQAVGAVQMEFAAKDRPVAKAREETFAAAPPPRIRIEGEVDLGDLRNPELLSAWTWWQNGLILELRIAAAGTVFEVDPLGNTDPLLVRQAKNEAKKLLFSVSKKKSRRARLVADEKPPIPAGR